jgi:hypothetical protein
LTRFEQAIKNVLNFHFQLFSNFTQQNGEIKPGPAKATANFDFGLDVFGTAKTTQNNGPPTKTSKVPDNWNPFLS